MTPFTKLEALNRRMLELEHNGDISEAEYATYKALLDWLAFSTPRIGDRLPIKDAQFVLEGLK